MVRKLLNNKWIEWSIILSMVLVVVLIFFTPNAVSLQRLTAHAFEAVLLFLASGLAFLMLGRPKIMFTCFALCMALCLYLKDKSNSGIQSLLPAENAVYSICQVLINAGSDQYEKITKSIVASDADIIQIQELTPDWLIVLSDALKSQYPYSSELNRIDPYGLVVFSKHPIQKLDTISYVDTIRQQDIPALQLQVNIHGREVDLITCHILQRLNNYDFDRTQGFMDSLTYWIKTKGGKYMMLSGELGITPWDYMMQKLVHESGLTLSRREPHLFVQPFEHILHSSNIICRELKEIVTEDRNHIGIQGFYTFRQTEETIGRN